MADQYHTLIFDLDGTISDPGTGFVRSINYALTEHDFAPLAAEVLHEHIGPPLDQSLAQITGVSDATVIASLVSKYRERYGSEGVFENQLYPGVDGVLLELATMPGITLGVCSSKRTDFVTSILNHYQLFDLFDFVSGGEIGIEKYQQLDTLKQEYRFGLDCVMIGDRKFDLIAAHRNNIASAGVLWGYGSKVELMAESPTHLLMEVNQLLGLARADN